MDFKDFKARALQDSEVKAHYEAIKKPITSIVLQIALEWQTDEHPNPLINWGDAYLEVSSGKVAVTDGVNVFHPDGYETLDIEVTREEVDSDDFSN